MRKLPDMAKATQPKDILSRIADLGEEAMGKIGDVPGGHKVMEMVNQSRSRLDEMQKRLRGLDELEKRVDKLEKRLAKLEPAKPKPAAASKPAAKKKPSA